MKGRDDLDKFFSQITKILKQGEQAQEFPKYFYNSYSAGDNKLYQKNISETKKFDDEWIKTVESYFPSLDRITKDPKSFIKYEEEITDIERAKKTNAKSVRHLASHTHLIRDIDEDDNVIPKKILTTRAEQDYEIYENRFIFTLINRLYTFVKNRYEVISANVESFQKDHFNSSSSFKMKDTDVSVEIDLVVKKDLDNKKINSHNFALLSRVEKLNTLVTGLKNSQFMKMMSKCRVVRPPIMKTNIILKNADFKSAYLLWLFLDRYNTLGFDVDVKEKELTFDPSFQQDLERLVLLNYSTILGNQEQRKDVYNAIGYEEYTKKRTRIVKTNAKDIVPNPDLIQIEDNTANEYFLMKYRQLFAQSVSKFEEDGKVKTESAMKKAIREATDIVNALFESVFEIQEETDVFKMLIKDVDLDKERDQKRDQLKYARMIREIKEVDYNNGLRREKKILKELIEINNKIIRRDILEKQEEAREKRKAVYEKTINDLKEENKEYTKRIKELENLNKLKDDEKALLQIERERATIRLKDEIEELKIKEKERIAEEKAKFEELKLQEKTRLTELKAREKEAIAARKIFFDQKMQEVIKQNEKELEETRKEHEEVLGKMISLLDSEREKYLASVKEEEESVLQERIDLEEKQKAIDLSLSEKHQRKLESLKTKQNEAIEEQKQLFEEEEKQQNRERIAISKVQKYEENLYMQMVSEEREKENNLRNNEVSALEASIQNIKDDSIARQEEMASKMLQAQLEHDEAISNMKLKYEDMLSKMQESFAREREEYLTRLTSLEEKEKLDRDMLVKEYEDLTKHNEEKFAERKASLIKEKEDLLEEIKNQELLEKMQREKELQAIEKVKAFELKEYEEKVKAIEAEKEALRNEALEKEKAEIEAIKASEEARKKAIIENEKKRVLEEKRLEEERLEALRKEKEALEEEKRLEEAREKEKIRLAKILQKQRENVAIEKVKAYEEKRKKGGAV